MALFNTQGTFGIVVSPIDALSENQVAESTRYKIRAVALTAEAMQQKPSLLDDIMNRHYDLCMCAKYSTSMNRCGPGTSLLVARETTACKVTVKLFLV